MAKQNKLKPKPDLRETRLRAGNAAGKVAKNPTQFAPPVDISSVSFEPNEPDLIRSWSAYASSVICINAYPNGITLSVHGKNKPSGKQAEQDDIDDDINLGYLPSQFHLRQRDTRDYLLPAGKYFLYKENIAASLEKKLSQLREQGVFNSAVVYFGMVTDPFRAFHKKFNVTMACLELLEQYRPGTVVVQTRCPMVISALPTLKVLGDRAVVAMPIESCLESAISRYTPGEPKIADRLMAADGLRAQGIKVNLVASPILPYGNVYRDAWDYADMLDKHADYITFGCLACGKPQNEPQLKELAIARKLVADKNYRWLRPHAYRNLYYALKVLAPEKLLLPVKPKAKAAQLDLFAA